MSLLLLVEDNTDLRETLTEILEDAGHQVAQARNGKVALELLREGLKPDLALLDLLMPVMSGGEFLAAWQSDPALPRFPVIVFSATAGSDPHLTGVSVVLRKGVGTNTVLETITELLEGV